jgi:hypothetical protein
MKYGIEVKLDGGEPTERWARVRPTGGKPYVYKTKEEASRMMRLCYDADPTIVRVVQVQP